MCLSLCDCVADMYAWSRVVKRTVVVIGTSVDAVAWTARGARAARVPPFARNVGRTWDACEGWLWVRDVAVGWAVHMPEDGAVPLPSALPSPGKALVGFGVRVGRHHGIRHTASGHQCVRATRGRFSGQSVMARWCHPAVIPRCTLGQMSRCTFSGTRALQIGSLS